MTDRTLDLTPLPKPVHPCAWMVGQLRSRTYTTAEELDAAKRARAWLEWLEPRIAGVEHTDPLLLAAFCRIAMVGAHRAWLDDAIKHVDRVVTDYEKTGGASPAPSNGHGFRME